MLDFPLSQRGFFIFNLQKTRISNFAEFLLVDNLFYGSKEVSLLCWKALDFWKAFRIGFYEISVQHMKHLYD